MAQETQFLNFDDWFNHFFGDKVHVTLCHCENAGAHLIHSSRTTGNVHHFIHRFTQWSAMLWRGLIFPGDEGTKHFQYAAQDKEGLVEFFNKLDDDQKKILGESLAQLVECERGERKMNLGFSDITKMRQSVVEKVDSIK